MRRFALPYALSMGLVCASARAAEPRLSTCPAAESAGIRTGDDGWVFTAPDLRTRFTLPDEAAAGLDRLLDALAAVTPTRVIVVVYPPRPLVVPEVLPAASWDAAAALAAYRSVVAHVASRHLDVVDLLDTARAVRGDEAFYFRRDHHITPTGARAAAAAIGADIRSRPEFARLPPSAFATHGGDTGPHDPDSRAAALANHCGAPVPGQIFQRWETVQVSGAKPGLLDDTAGPGVVMTGTSNLSPQYNLSGFLEEDLGAQVLPVSVAGGGLLGSLQAWLRSPEWEAHPPAFLVWEFSPQAFGLAEEGTADPANPAIYRELVPSVRGSCADADAAALGAWTDGAAGEHVLLDEVAAAGARGPGWRVLVETEDPGLRAFTLELEMADGSRDTHAYAPMMRTDTHGRFFLDLPEHAQAPLSRVRVRLGEASPGRLRARLCRP